MLKVLRVVVAVADAEGAEGGTGLAHVNVLSVHNAINLGETTAELTTLTSGLLGGPGVLLQSTVSVGLAVVLEQLSQRVATSE